MEPAMDYEEFAKIESLITQKSEELKELRQQRKAFLEQIEEHIEAGELGSFTFGPNVFVMQEKKKQSWNKKTCMEAAVNGMLDVDQHAEGGEFVRSLKRKRVKN